jgi:hypothetical protein
VIERWDMEKVSAQETLDTPSKIKPERKQETRHTAGSFSFNRSRSKSGLKYFLSKTLGLKYRGVYPRKPSGGRECLG